jgi:hypothetical protein
MILGGSGSFHQQANKVRKTLLDVYYFVTSFWFFIYENWCKWNAPSKSNKQKNFFFVGILSVTNEKAGSGSESVSLLYGFSDPDPYHHVTDPQHCCCLISDLSFSLIQLIASCLCTFPDILLLDQSLTAPLMSLTAFPSAWFITLPTGFQADSYSCLIGLHTFFHCVERYQVSRNRFFAKSDQKN